MWDSSSIKYMAFLCDGLTGIPELLKWFIMPDHHIKKLCTVKYPFETSFFSKNLTKEIRFHSLPMRPKSAQCCYELIVWHDSDVIMSVMASQITGVSVVYSTVCLGTDERKHQSSTSLAFLREIHRWPVNSLHKWPVMQKMFPFDDVIMLIYLYPTPLILSCYMWYSAVIEIVMIRMFL